MTDTLAAAFRFAFYNELPPVFAESSGRFGRTRLRAALSELLNWLKARAGGYASPRMSLYGSPVLSTLRLAVQQSSELSQIFAVEGNFLVFRARLKEEDVSAVLDFVRQQHHFPEDVLIRPAR